MSWAFVDEYVEQTLAHRGWGRRRTDDQRAQIGQRFRQVGRLTLEDWLVPRLTPGIVHSHPRGAVTAVSDSEILR